MGEVRFYHLSVAPLERALPVMLERTLERGGRAVVRGTDRGRLADLDTRLWTYRDESFLAHGIDGDPEAARQPVWLTTGDTVPNGATTLFLIDSADASGEEFAAMALSAVLFDGHDPLALEFARGQWRRVVEAGLGAVYWAQNPQGAWEQRHQSPAKT